MIEALKKHYAQFTPEFAEKESGVRAEIIVKTAREIAEAGSRFASHLCEEAPPEILADGSRCVR